MPCVDGCCQSPTVNVVFLTTFPCQTLQPTFSTTARPRAKTRPARKWFLLRVRDAIRVATWARRIRRFLLKNGAASPPHPCAGKYGKTSKPPRFTNSEQETINESNDNYTACLRKQR